MNPRRKKKINTGFCQVTADSCASTGLLQASAPSLIQTFHSHRKEDGSISQSTALTPSDRVSELEPPPNDDFLPFIDAYIEDEGLEEDEAEGDGSVDSDEGEPQAAVAPNDRVSY